MKNYTQVYVKNSFEAAEKVSAKLYNYGNGKCIMWRNQHGENAMMTKETLQCATRAGHFSAETFSADTVDADLLPADMWRNIAGKTVQFPMWSMEDMSVITEAEN